MGIRNRRWTLFLRMFTLTELPKSI